MNTINCRIKVNDHHDLSGRSVTPAEVVVLYFLHHNHAGGHPIRKPTQSGPALMVTPEGKVRERTDLEEYERLRSYYKMRSSPDKPNSSFLDDLFPGVATGGARLPQTFDQLPEPYKLKEPIGAEEEPVMRTKDFVTAEPITAAAAKALDAAKNPVNNVTETVTGEGEKSPEPSDPGAGIREVDITTLTKAQLLDLADDYQIKVSGGDTKEAIIKAIQAGMAPREQAAQ